MEKVIFDSNVFINNQTFDRLKRNIIDIKTLYHLMATPYQLYEINAGREKDERTEEKYEFCKENFEITYDINIFPMFLGIRLCSEDQLKIYRELLYRTLSGKIAPNQEVIDKYLNEYVSSNETIERKQRDVRIGSIAYFENAIVIIDGEERFRKTMRDLGIKNQQFEEFLV